MKKIAITGNMGTGKSYVSKCIKEAGISVLDMDVCAREVRQNCLDEISSLFHVDANNEKEVANVVFKDDEKRIQLEQLLYPKMFVSMEDFFKEHEDEILVCVEVPLLFEKEWENYFDEVWCVSCSLDTALERLMQFRGYNKEAALARLNKQMSLKEKENRSHYVFYNDKDKDVKQQVMNKLKEEGYAC